MHSEGLKGAFNPINPIHGKFMEYKNVSIAYDELTRH